MCVCVCVPAEEARRCVDCRPLIYMYSLLSRLLLWARMQESNAKSARAEPR